MLKRSTWLIILMIATVALWGCSSDDDSSTTLPVQTAFETMAAAGMAYVNDNTDCPGVESAVTVDGSPGNYTIIDVRSLGEYNTSHITGAYHSTLATLLNDLKTTIPTGKPYVLVCKTGQSAGHAKIAMELMGYEDVKTMGYGMSSWSPSLDNWTTNCLNNLPTIEKTNNNASLTEHAFPTLTGSASTIVETRVQWMLQQGFKGKSWIDIKDNLGAYFILNYFGEADYLGSAGANAPGHIPGAFQFTPYMSLGDTQMLKNLPTDKQIIVYCWTGQHSSQVTAYLNMLGYDAYSFKFGSNNLFYTSLGDHKWSAPNNFPLWTPMP